MNFDRIKEETAAKEEGLEFWANKGQRKSKYFVYLAWGRESGGRELLLNVKDAEVTEDVLETNTLPPRNIIEYLNDLKEAYRNLRLIPCQGRVTIEADDVAERSSHISKRQVLAQSESWGTDLDIQYVRQLYRQHGWPDAFRRKDAENAVEELMEAVLDQRDDEWEREMEDWLSDCEQEEWSSGDESDYRELELTIATKHE
ncbi:hypothetical protein HIM_10550 [Hirsutella minnesotensis 3608]|uniref:Uncharacterized protein n=1 Tax=Hirsutella minnesotensis 3608 TaxID=1043627 RepID=A0A0F7ZG04_9HYPO|nr:hypothetical protein HIM_10550 [Hirsutella minnesotensis 3608]